MVEEFKLKKEFTDEVISDTIMFDSVLRWLFWEYFEIKPEPNNPKRETQIERFDRYFMDQMGASSKLGLLKEVLEDLYPGIIYPNDFENKFLEFHKLRNIFAHSMFPREVNQKTPYVSRTGSWEELYQRHQELYKELVSFVGGCTARFGPVK